MKVRNLLGLLSEYSYGKKFFLIIPISCLVFALYFQTLHASFVFDDFKNIVDNRPIHLQALTFSNLKMVVTDGYLLNRPVSSLSFALNYYFNQDRVFGYHLVNILIHLTNGFLLYLFIRLTMGLPVIRSRYREACHFWLPVLTALVWVAQPIHIQSVTYIVQRMNSLAAMFYLLSFILYIKGRIALSRKGRLALFAGSIISGLLAIGSKEMVVVLPFFICLYEWFFFQDLERSFIKRHCLNVGVPLLVLTFIVLFLFIGSSPFEMIMASYRSYDFNLVQRVLTEFRVLIFYITLLLFPHPARLNIDHNFILSRSMFAPLTTIFSLLLVVGLISLAVGLARKERLASFCILWFFLNLLVESSFLPLDLVFEHRTYIPSMLAVLLLLMFADRYIRAAHMKLILVAGLILLSSVWTFERNKVWHNRITLWEDCVKKSPNKIRALNGLGAAYYTAGHYEEAILCHQKALQIDTNVPDSHYFLANALKDRWLLKEAAFHYLRTIQLLPTYQGARENLSAINRMIKAKKLRGKPELS